MTDLEHKNPAVKAVDLFYLAIILLACFKLTYSITDIVDLMLADESIYLKRALEFKLNYFFKDGFVYWLWLKLLSLFIPDMLILYCYNYALLLSLNPVLIYVLSRKMGKKPFISALFSIFFLISTFNIFTWPYITRFAITVILLIFIALFSIKNNNARVKYYIALSGLLVLVYVRPEFVLSLVLFSAAALVYFIVKFYKSPRKGYATIFLLIITLTAAIFVSFIKNPANTGRSVFAFGQHYGLNLQKREILELDPLSDWRQVMIDKFKTDESLFTAIINNPTEMSKHIFANIKQFPLQFLYQMFPYNSQRWPGLVKKIIFLFIVLLFLVSLLNFLRNASIHQKNIAGKNNVGGRFKISHLRISNLQENDLFFYFISVLLIIPVIISILLIYPRTHYMLVLFAVIYLAMVKNLPEFPNFSRYDWLARKAVIVLLLFFIPWKVSGTSGFLPGESRKGCSILKRVQTIKKIEVNSDVHLSGILFGYQFNYAVFRMYLENNSRYAYNIYQLEMHTPVDSFFKEKSINMIVVNKKLATEEQFKSFISEISFDYWTRYDIPGCNEFILVKNDIIR